MLTVLVCHSLGDRRPVIRELLARNPTWTIAESGSAAETFRVLAEQDVGVVLTDLNVPDVDGGAFVEALRARFPQIPTIVITPRGPDKALVRALLLGAASYVPQGNLARDLGGTVERLLALADPRPTWTRIQAGWRATDISFTLSNDLRMIPDVISYLQDELSRYGICGPDHRTRVGMALTEALANAIIHGNLEISSAIREKDVGQYEKELLSRLAISPFNERFVRLRASFAPEGARFTIADDGAGFDIRSVPDPTVEENLLKLTGRGLLLMRAFADGLHFNERGNEVTLTVTGRRGVAAASDGPGDVRAHDR